MTATQLSPGRALRPTAKVLPEHARGHNRSLVLQTLYRASGQSRADVARETGLTRVTISDLVAELIAEGLVVETRPARGRPPRQAGHPARLRPRRLPDRRPSTSRDDSVFRGAVLDLDGTILARDEIALAGSTGAEAIAKVLELADRARRRGHGPAARHRRRLPRHRRPRRASCSRAPNLRLDLGRPARHARRALRGSRARRQRRQRRRARRAQLRRRRRRHHAHQGRPRCRRRPAASAARPLFGSHFAAGEIGHVVVGTDGGPCAPAARPAASRPGSPPRGSTARIAAITATGAEADAERDTVLREAGRRLGIILAPVVGALDLSEIVLSGPTELLDGPLATATIETIRTRTMAEFTRRSLTVRMTTLGAGHRPARRRGHGPIRTARGLVETLRMGVGKPRRPGQ